jgi:hypothetical protein
MKWQRCAGITGSIQAGMSGSIRRNTHPSPPCPVVYGYGEDTSLAKAIRDAKSDANSKVPPGCQAKHCTYKCTGPRGDPIYPSN